MSEWVEVKALLSSQPEDWSPFADAFDRHGCPSSLQQDHPPAISGYLTVVDGTEGKVEDLKDALLSLGAEEVQTHTVPDEDWTELWKQHFKPRRIGKRIVIRPTWEDYETNLNDVEIVLDPGQAFGTGDHPTTRLCLQLMDSMDFSGKEVADVGCGSGILSIAAVKLGASRVIGTDIEDLSVEVAKENSKRNEAIFDCFVADGFAAFGDKQFDVVISNIISATLIRMAPDAAQHVKPGGEWIVSGIYRGNWPDVKSAAEAAGFRLERTEEEEDWMAARFRR